MIKKALDKVSSSLSDKHLIVFDYRSVLFISLLILCFTFAVTLKLSTSSSSIWWQYQGKSFKENTLLGSPKGIRSDEWLVNTPFILSQTKQGFPVENASIGSNKDTLLMNVPVKHWSLILKPQHWGFFFLDTERGFSFYWCYKILILLVSSFLMIMLLTRSNFILSLFGSVWIFFSSFTQWWFSANVPETLGLAFLATLSVLYFIFSSKKPLIYSAGVVFLISGFGFVTLFYPPFQIPIVFLCLAIFVGYCLRVRKDIVEIIKKQFKTKIVFLTGAIILLAVSLGLYVKEAFNTIKSVTSTTYPGKRFFTGGKGLWMYGGGYYTNLINDKTMTPVLGNMCESSNFINLFPVVFLSQAALVLKKIKLDPMLFALSIYTGGMFVWSVFGINDFFARVSLMSNAQTSRALLAIGISGILLAIVFLANNYKFKVKETILLTLLSIIPIYIFTQNFLNTTLFSANKYHMGMIALILIIATASIFLGKKYIFMIAILLLVLPNVKVNPITHGLGPLKDPALSSIVKEKKDKWIVYGDMAYSAYLKALGANVASGVNYTPNEKLWSIFDPTDKDKEIHNRYAHVSVEEESADRQPFYLNQADSLTWRVNPCDERLKEAGINRLAFTYQPDTDKYNCLVPVPDNSGASLYLFSYK